MVDINTEILGLIGYPLSHSLSPLLHNHSIKEMGLNYVYLAFPIKEGELEKAIHGFRAINVRGLNVTIPYKEAVIPLLDEIDSLAKKVGAVNTILNENGVLKGYNTDVIGLSRMIEEDANFTIKDKKAIILGAGGAARATGIALLQKGVGEIHLLNRTISKAKDLAKDWQAYYPDSLIKVNLLDEKIYKEFIAEVDIIIDTTPVGMSPKHNVEPLIKEKYLNKDILVVDLVYNPQETSLLKAAKRRSAPNINGMGMLLYQGIESFKIWTNHEINVSKWRELSMNM
ncbi:shikimate dehydrogenase [Natronospora cellulosivora (SeqCode)]